ncbi:hypothetical protein ABPG77_007362 [Micractinium sp. CCAP 211/92]
MLQGATYWFIRHALSYSVHDMDNAGPDILDSHSTPLFSRLSLSHRLALLAELAEGLLVPDTPLPPDTLEHHAAFLFLYCFALHIIEGSDLDGIGLSEEEEEDMEASEEDEEEEDLGELGEDKSAEMAAQLRSALEAAAPAMAAAEEAAAPAREQERRQYATLGTADEWYRKDVRFLMVSRKDDIEDKKLVASVAEGLQGLSDEALVRVMMSGQLRCGRTYPLLRKVAETVMELAPDIAAAEAALRDLTLPHITRRRMQAAADEPPPAGPITFGALLAAHVRQRLPQLSRLDRYCDSHETWSMLCSPRFGLGPCLELSDEEKELQFGTFHDACYHQREDVARTLLVERHVQRATQAFQQRWEPEMDVLNWRLIQASCPPTGWFTPGHMKPSGYGLALGWAEAAWEGRRQYIQLLRGASEDPALLEKAQGVKNELNFSVAEDSNWVPDWHKAVRRLGGYGSMAARLQAVRLVHPRHPSAAMVVGRPLWLGSKTPEEQVAELRRQQWNMQCSNPLCRKLAEVGTKYKLCSRCKVAFYCCEECQVEDWALHKVDCPKLAEEWAAKKAERGC